MWWDIYKTWADMYEAISKKTGEYNRGKILDRNKLYDKTYEETANNPELLSAFIHCVTDKQFEEEGRPTYFIEKESIVSLLIGSSFDVLYDEIVIPNNKETLCVSFPCKMRIPPVVIRKASNMLLIAMQGENDTVGETCHMERWKGVQKLSDDIPRDYDGKWTEDKKKLFGKASILILKFLVYIQAFPDLIRPGYPDVTKNRMKKYHANSGIGAYTIGINKTDEDHVNASRSMHLRCGHFRALRHEKFKRDAKGNVRITWVRASIVGGKIDPYTVHEE